MERCTNWIGILDKNLLDISAEVSYRPLIKRFCGYVFPTLKFSTTENETGSAGEEAIVEAVRDERVETHTPLIPPRRSIIVGRARSSSASRERLFKYNKRHISIGSLSDGVPPYTARKLRGRVENGA